MILKRLQECGLKLSPKKCHLSRTRVMYVGHIASEHGIEHDPHKIDKVTHWPTPTWFSFKKCTCIYSENDLKITLKITSGLGES